MVHVSNDGPGIDPKELSAIFEKFYRGKDVRSRIPGTGLGLTIAREIVSTHGGELTVSSQTRLRCALFFLATDRRLAAGSQTVDGGVRLPVTAR